MSPAEKTKQLKKTTEAAINAPIASRTRVSNLQPPQPPVTMTEPTMSTNELLEALKLYLNPQVEELKAKLEANSVQAASRFNTLEESMYEMKVDLYSQQQELENRITKVMDRLTDVEEENRTLRAALVPTSQVQDPDAPMPDDSMTFPPLEQGTASSKYASTPNIHIPPTTEPSTATSRTSIPPTTTTPSNRLRLFTTVSKNQGFTYLFLPLRARVPFKEIRATLREIPLNPGSVIDIYYPAAKVVALLFHNDYAPKARSLLKANGLSTIDNFNPLDPSNLADPKFKDATFEDRSSQMQIIQENQMFKTLAFLKSPVKLAVARDFHRKGRLSDSALQDLINLHRSSPPPATPASNPFGPLLKDSNLMADAPMNENDEDDLMSPAPFDPDSNTEQDVSMDPQGQAPMPMVNNSSAGGGEPAKSH